MRRKSTSHRGNLIRQLLAYAAGARVTPGGHSDRAPEDSEFASAEFQWLLDAGLGPLLHAAVEEGAIASPSLMRRRQLGAIDLLARVSHEARVDVACEVLDVCTALGIRPTLLKGIAVADQFYPAPHYRDMADIDVLVPAESYGAIEARLVGRGYKAIPYPMRHHGPPLCHPDRRVCVELHIDLFPEDCPLRPGRVLSRKRAWANSRASSLHDRPVGRLSPAFQLVYLASCWINDLTNSGIRPTFLRLLVDLIYLLRFEGASIDWDDLLNEIDNKMARASTLVTIEYLNRHGLASVPKVVVSALSAKQQIVGAWQSAMFRAAIDRHLIAGRPWRLPVPPPVPGRYGLRFQFEKRVLGRFPVSD